MTISRWRAVGFSGLLALVSHVLLGWILVIPAAAVGGWMSARRGWLTGLLGVVCAWAIMLGYSWALAPDPTAEMTRVVAALAGGLPPFATVALTLLVGAALGAAGGGIGSALRNIRDRRRR